MFVITITVPEDGNVSVRTKSRVDRKDILKYLDIAITDLQKEREAFLNCEFHKKDIDGNK